MKVQVEQLTESMQINIDRWVAKFPEGQARSASLMALRIVQDEVGHLTPGWMSAVASYLKVEVTKIYEVATFYGMYHHQPVGRYHLRVCNNISCCLQGSSQTLAYLKDQLGLIDQRISDDGLFSITETECLAACTDAPVMVVNDREYVRQLTPQSIDEWIKERRQEHLND